MPVVRGVISCLDRGRVEVVRPRVDVAEDRRDLLPLQGVGGRDERERRHDDLAGQAGGADGDLQRDACRCTWRCSADAEQWRRRAARTPARAGRRWSASGGRGCRRCAPAARSRSPMLGGRRAAALRTRARRRRGPGLAGTTSCGSLPDGSRGLSREQNRSCLQNCAGYSLRAGPTMLGRMELQPLGDQAALAYLADEEAALRFAAAVRGENPRWLVDVVQAYTSVAVFFDLDQTGYGRDRRVLAAAQRRAGCGRWEAPPHSLLLRDAARPRPNRRVHRVECRGGDPPARGGRSMSSTPSASVRGSRTWAISRRR